MENVAAFNSELSGLYETKPPISKAKMASITKAAMRAIKFYKHVVQSVEKFILKCKPEYKVPGLYVIDSIVRQSRHQFGSEKDVFAPRFARNIKETFANLFRCAPEDKSRVIRVLNLWQKNNVFSPEILQPIFDLADPNHPMYQMQPPVMGNMSGGAIGLADLSANSTNGLNASNISMDMNMGNMSNISAGQVEDKMTGLPDLSSMSHEKAQNVLDKSSLRQLEHMQQYLKRQTATTATSSSAKSRDTHGGHNASYGCLIDATGATSGGSGGGCGVGVGGSSSKIHHAESYSKYLKNAHENLYEDERDDCFDDSSPHNTSNLLDKNNIQQLLNDPNVLRQLQTLQNFQKRQQDDKQHKLNEMRLQEEAFEKHLQNVLKGPPTGQEMPEFKEVEFVSEEPKIEVINLDPNDSRSPSPDRDRYKRRRSRSRSRSRERRRRRSRSRSRSRSPRMNRRRMSRDRDRSTRDKEREREHERERRRKGLPEIRREHLSVCSTTLWVGHLSKLVYQEELSDTFGEYGDIVSIDQIVPRGCAFIVMHRRQDAYKAMQSLKNHKLQGRAITISWAAGKGVKSKEWKDFWDLDLGVTYIPWNKLEKDTDFDSLEEGGMFDEDSMPGWMKDKINHMKSLKEKAAIEAAIAPVAAQNTNTVPGPGNLMFNIDTTQPPPGPPPVSGPPPMLPMVPNQFTMAPPRLMGHMGMPLQGMPPNLVPGMPPNLVPNMPPPHLMMTNILPPGFPPIPQVGGAAPPPMGAPPLGLPPGASQYPPPPIATAAAATGIPPPANNMSNITNDDHMDIEMDEDDSQHVTQVLPPAPIVSAPQINFNQPPPMFTPAGMNTPNEFANESPQDIFNRDRSRNSGGGGGAGSEGGSGGGNSSRWGGRGDDDGNNDRLGRWHENNGQQNFNDNRGGMRNNGPINMNMGPMDMNNQQQRPDFMGMGGDFDLRGGPGPRGNNGGRGGNMNGDFFQNMQNRFNQPTSLLQMRIQPPNNYNQRMNNPPMFMRGQGGPGNRQQGPGFFNPRNPFDRDNNMRGNRGNSGNVGRSGGRGGGRNLSGSGNWSDEDADESNNFKRRGGHQNTGNRFRDRDHGNSGSSGGGGSEDRYNRDRGGRRGFNERSGQRDRREDRDYRDNDRSSSKDRSGVGRSSSSSRRHSKDDDIKSTTSNSVAATTTTANQRTPSPIGIRQKSVISDTEDDWDRELQEYDAKMQMEQNRNIQQQQQQQQQHEEEQQHEIEHMTTKKNTNIFYDDEVENTDIDERNFNNQNYNDKEQQQQQQPLPPPPPPPPTTQPQQREDVDNFIKPSEAEKVRDVVPLNAANSTPLYDELPPPGVSYTATSSPTPPTPAPVDLQEQEQQEQQQHHYHEQQQQRRSPTPPPPPIIETKCANMELPTSAADNAQAPTETTNEMNLTAATAVAVDEIVENE